MHAATFATPGATLYYETRGSGPILLLLAGSGGDAAIFDTIIDSLAAHFTTVALDPRGYSRSTLAVDEPLDQAIDVISEDLHRLLEFLTPAGEDAYVFGGSGGAVIALDLLARHPERLRKVVAHEPPCFQVLPDARTHRAFVDEVRRLFHTEGLAAAGAHFLAGIGGSMKPLPDPAELPPRRAEMIQRIQANTPAMMEHELGIVTSYRPDETALAAVADRLVLGAGRDDPDRLPCRPAATLADRLGIDVVRFPGGHSGFTDAPEEFTTLLLALLLA
ncbi:alpha/beta fold hydrolase [Nocardia callitridis]|uniref:Alpha/beta hydrolase n=1 Tax=Nocardia callitridis TaxID=648753 RepID=A0ABP9K5X7_9NOCA